MGNQSLTGPKKKVGPSSFHREWESIECGAHCNVHSGSKLIFFEKCSVSDIDRVIEQLASECSANPTVPAVSVPQQFQNVFRDSIDELIRDSNASITFDRALALNLMTDFLEKFQADPLSLYLAKIKVFKKHFAGKRPKMNQTAAKRLHALYEANLRIAMLPEIVRTLKRLKGVIALRFKSKHAKFENVEAFLEGMHLGDGDTMQRIALIEFYRFRAVCPFTRRLCLILDHFQSVTARAKQQNMYSMKKLVESLRDYNLESLLEDQEHVARHIDSGVLHQNMLQCLAQNKVDCIHFKRAMRESENSKVSAQTHHFMCYTAGIVSASHRLVAAQSVHNDGL